MIGMYHSNTRTYTYAHIYTYAHKYIHTLCDTHIYELTYTLTNMPMKQGMLSLLTSQFRF